MKNLRTRLASVVAALALVTATAGVVASTTGPAAAAVTPATGAAGALAIAQAMAAPSANVTGASFTATTDGTPNGTSDSALGEFPTDGSTFGILTSGDVNSVPQPGLFAQTDNQGTSVRGDSDFDVSILKTDISVPSGANCLTFDFKFLSEEFPRYVGQQFNDAFIAELDNSTWTTSGSAITAPDNFAFDSSNDVVSVNSTGIGGMTPADGAGTAYDGVGDNTDGAATDLLHASRQITPGAHSLYLSIFDQGDNVLDSAVFLDNLTVGFVPDPAVNCVAGAKPVTAQLDLTPTTATSPTGTAHTLTATLTNGDGAPISGAAIAFTVTGVNPGTGTATTNASGVATFSYTGTNAGTDQIAACYDADNTLPCEALASATKVWESVGNTPPVANDQSVSTNRDTAAAVTLTASDADGDSLTYAVGSGPSHGTLSGVAPNLTYTPMAGYTGPDSFTFTANDGQADSNVATVSIEVQSSTNCPPVADSQSVTTPKNTAVPIVLTGSDSNGDALTYQVGTGPSHGTLSGVAPNLTYTPEAGYRGSDAFTFTVNDGQATSAAATVTITVTGHHKPPNCHFHGKHDKGSGWHIPHRNHWMHLSNGHHGVVAVWVLVNGRFVSAYLADGASKYIDIGDALNESGNNQVFLRFSGMTADASADVSFEATAG